MVYNINIKIGIDMDKKENMPLLRKPYEKPALVELGDIRSLTLGASPAGFKDSGAGLYTETFPTLMPPILGGGSGSGSGSSGTGP
jgi:hypothetical protein